MIRCQQLNNIIAPSAHYYCVRTESGRSDGSVGAPGGAKICGCCSLREYRRTARTRSGRVWIRGKACCNGSRIAPWKP